MRNNDAKMTKRNGAPKDSVAEKILNVCICIALFALVMMTYTFVSEYRDYGRGYFTEDYVISCLQYGSYARITDSYYSGWEDVSEDPKREEIASLARYLNAAFMHHTFETYGLEKKAAQEKNRMDENAAKLRMYGPEKEKIDRLFEEK